jgi:hypothetical protein
MFKKLFGSRKKVSAPTTLPSPQVVSMNELDYDPKIVVAWAKAIEGNKEITNWLYENGFKELCFAIQAIYLKNEARDWLMQNGYPHLMAMIHAAEGNANAQKWLQANGFEQLYHIAMAVEDEQESWKWLQLNAGPDVFILAKVIKEVKDRIEETHNDIHFFGRDI